MKKSLLAITLGISSLSAYAADNGAVGARLSTLGFGIEYSFPVQEQLDVGVNANYFQYKKNFDEDDLTLDGKLKLLTFGVLGRYYPWNNGFNINGGLYYNGSQIDVNIQPKDNGNTYKFNNEEYSAKDVENAYGSVDFNKISPYIGIGWRSGDRSQEGLAFDANLGVMFQGAPKLNAEVNCSANLLSTANGRKVCDDLKNDLEVERKEKQDKVDDTLYAKFWPMVSVGFVYRF